MIDKNEVVRSYKQNPTTAQIKVISELWDTTQKQIKDILKEYGIIPRLKRDNRGKKKKDDLADIEYQLKLLEFRCLSCPETQPDYFDEMQELRAKVNQRYAL